MSREDGGAVSADVEYRLRTLALPMGAYPQQLEWVIQGSADGVSYRHEAILEVTGGAAPAPFSRRFDPYRLPRVQAVESELAFWLRHFDRHPGDRFVNDGDPATVTIPKGRRGELRDLGGRSLRIIERD